MPNSKSDKPTVKKAVTKKVAPKKTVAKKAVKKKTVAKRPSSKTWVNQTKYELFEKNESFCILPWIHLHTTPTGQAAPCCISNSCADNIGVGNSNTDSLEEIVNSPKMKKLRVDMINGVKNEECTNCHRHDEKGVPSARVDFNNTWMDKKDIVDIVKSTEKDGEVKDFQMKYFDIRFSNICNFKCRTCGSAFSSLWEAEDLKSKEKTGLPFWAQIVPKGNREEFIDEILEQVENFEIAYFAGGEPLITEEHYLLLERMIKTGKTDIELRYNSNISNLKFKKKDIFTMWNMFSQPIKIYASIDHIGDRAEYIRNGTIWKKVEENFKKIKKASNIEIEVNTVYSIFNAITISHFYKFMIDNHYYTPESNIWTLYCMNAPEHLSVHVLPPDYKQQADQQLDLTINYMRDLGFRDDQIQQIEQAKSWLNIKDTWAEQSQMFKEELCRLDDLRDEDFAATFPELQHLYKKPESLRP
jgi:organic radical activating enzyme